MEMELIKINKSQARKMHSKGARVFCLPSKTNPRSVWARPAEIPANSEFDTFCNNYQYYNCGYPELGKAIAFYKEK